MPDPVTGLTVAGAVGVAAKQLQDFIAAISGHPGESIGTILGGVAKRRHENAGAVGEKAYLTLLDIGVQPQAIPLPVLVPLMEGASLQEDPSIQELWANLLATAADPRHASSVVPSFPTVLRELRHIDAKWLEGLYNNTRRIIKIQKRNPAISPNKVQEIQYDHRELLKLFVALGLARSEQLTGISVKFYEENHDNIDADMRDFDLLISVVRRLGIIKMVEKIPPQHIETPDPNEPFLLDVDTRELFFFTAFGEAFMNACLPPLSLDDPPEQPPIVITGPRPGSL
jgi:hypothetical protein